ncbi:MAG: guanylate kinase [Candidatus Omnitrophota bacterium]
MNRKPGRIIILSGPSGAGKTTLHDLLLKTPAFVGRTIRSISATTRLPRGEERHGREYYFLTRKMFEYKIKAGHFLEWMRVFDHYYGTPMKQVRENLRRGKNVLLCIDVKGALLVKKKMPQALMIFVKTPTIKELRRRLESRGTDTPESIALRLKTAQEELQQESRYDQVIVNDDLKKAFLTLVSVLEKGLR